TAIQSSCASCTGAAATGSTLRGRAVWSLPKAELGSRPLHRPRAVLDHPDQEPDEDAQARQREELADCHTPDWDRRCIGPGEVLQVGERAQARYITGPNRSEEHTSELQSRGHLVCRLLLEKKKERKC